MLAKSELADTTSCSIVFHHVSSPHGGTKFQPIYIAGKSDVRLQLWTLDDRQVFWYVLKPGGFDPFPTI